ncbi:RYamide receptor, partial [Gryllus bimaculatus]
MTASRLLCASLKGGGWGMDDGEGDGDVGRGGDDDLTENSTSQYPCYQNVSVFTCNYTDAICVIEDGLASPYFQAAVYVCYVSVLLLALLGNGLVCYVVYASPRMWTVTNYFIVNLAVGDVLLTLLCVPFSFVATLLLQHWPFGPELCRTVSFSQATSVLVSAYTLVAISLDRYVAIRWPLRPRLSKRHAKAVIGAVWLVAVLTAAPIALLSTLTQPSEWHAHCGFFVCEEVWPSAQDRYYY